MQQRPHPYQQGYPQQGWPQQPLPPRPPPPKSRLWLVLAIIGVLMFLAIAGTLIAFREPILAIFGEPAANLRDKKTHDADGLSFDYPGNWTAEAETSNESGIIIDAVTVDSPGSCVAIVQRFRSPVDPDPSGYATAYANALSNQKEKSGGLISASQQRSENFQGELTGAAARGQRVRVVVTAFGEKVPSTLEVLAQSTDSRTLVLVTSCPDEDMAQAKPGFELIRKSLAVEP